MHNNSVHIINNNICFRTLKLTLTWGGEREGGREGVEEEEKEEEEGRCGPLFSKSPVIMGLATPSSILHSLISQ